MNSSVIYHNLNSVVSTAIYLKYMINQKWVPLIGSEKILGFDLDLETSISKYILSVKIIF